MASQCKVQDIKKKFEDMIVENRPLVTQCEQQLSKHSCNERVSGNCSLPNVNIESESDEECIKVPLSRQPSDPAKKLQRSHAFRCDRNQKITNRQSHSPSSEKRLLTTMCDTKLSKERLKMLGNVLEDRMKKENFVTNSVSEVRCNSIPDAEVPKHILDQYAKVNKPRNEPKKDATVDSGVGSETENLDDEKYGQIRKTNLNFLNDSNSDDTIRLEKKNPHVRLTDTLKKALKQPLPLGPPPEKPPRTFVSSPAQEKKSTKHMLQKLEQELLKREAKEREKKNVQKNPKELHYMCTEIFDIQQRSLPNPKSDNGAIKNNTSTLPEHLNGTSNGKLRQEEHTYDTPYEISNPTENEKSEEPKSDFEKIRRSFESGFKKSDIVTEKRRNTNTESSLRKPVMESKIKNLRSDLKYGRKFATDSKRYYRKTDRNERLSLPKKSSRVDVEKETFYRLMDEIYATVKIGSMEDDRLGGLTDGSTTDESVKVTRSLTEKRKNYVRGISSRVAYLDPTNVKTVRSKTTTCTYQDIENPYSTHRSWKSFRTSQKDLSESNMADLTDAPAKLSMDDSLSIDEKTGCLDIELCFEPRDRGLFNVCMLVGFNFMNSQAYVKSVFPDQVKPPAHIESLIFPETLSSGSKVEWKPDAASTQCYSLVLTDEKGERSYGYCRRVLPEGASACLPLAYCLIGKYRAPGFYYKVLQEIESLHGNSEYEINSILQQLFETDFPEPGGDISITYTDQILNNTSLKNQFKIADMCRSKTMLELRRRKRDISPAGENLTRESTNIVREDTNIVREESKNLRECSNIMRECSNLMRENSNATREGSNTMRESSNIMREGVKIPVKRKVLMSKRLANSMVPDYYDLENNNKPRDNYITKLIKRPLEPRVDEHNLITLLDALGAGLTIKLFGSLLLERKVFLISDKLSQVSSCIEALQSSIYPFVWQHTLISIVPAEIQRDMLEAPLPIFAGVLKVGSNEDDNFAGIKFEGMLIDLTNSSKVLFYEGDESTILPAHSYKTLKTSLQMWTGKHKDKQEDRQTRSVMISEAFLRFFVDILGDFWKFFAFGEMKKGGLGKGGVVFDKESFVKNATSKQNQHFLEWFTETAMFNHFIKNMAAVYRIRQSEAGKSNIDQSQSLDLVDTPLPNYYEVFDERVKSRCKNMNVPSRKNLAFLKNKMRDMLVKFQK